MFLRLEWEEYSQKSNIVSILVLCIDDSISSKLASSTHIALFPILGQCFHRKPFSWQFKSTVPFVALFFCEAWKTTLHLYLYTFISVLHGYHQQTVCPKNETFSYLVDLYIHNLLYIQYSTNCNMTGWVNAGRNSASAKNNKCFQRSLVYKV